jgi:WD40 repeat protein
VEQLQLERVIGLSPPSAYTVSHNPAREGVVAYPAGSVVVIYDIISKLQLRYLQSPGGGKLLNCTAFSRDGKSVAAGERGHAPCVLVWDVESGRCVQQLKGHKYGVASLSFSADGGCKQHLATPPGGRPRAGRPRPEQCAPSPLSSP